MAEKAPIKQRLQDFGHQAGEFIATKVLYPVATVVEKRIGQGCGCPTMLAELALDVKLAWDWGAKAWQLGEKLGWLAVDHGAPMVVGAAILGLTTTLGALTPLAIKSVVTHQIDKALK